MTSSDGPGDLFYSKNSIFDFDFNFGGKTTKDNSILFSKKSSKHIFLLGLKCN